jgi:hypothetical protein
VRKLYTPRYEVELLILRTLLSAYNIPHCVTAGFGAAYPGLQIDNYTTKTILVAPSAYEEASGLLQQYLSAPEPRYEPMRPWDRLRVILEAVIFGWFVPKCPVPIVDQHDVGLEAGER